MNHRIPTLYLCFPAIALAVIVMVPQAYGQQSQPYPQQSRAFSQQSQASAQQSAFGQQPQAFPGQVVPVANVVPATQKVSHPLDPALAMARASLQHVQANVHDYTALFVKRCRVDDELPPLQFARVKIRNPRTIDGQATSLSVYLKYLRPSSVRGREVIWVDGQNDGNLVAHEGGFAKLISLRLDPNGYLAMRGQRRPISDIGIENLLKKIIEMGERDRRHKECEVQFFKNAKIGNVGCTVMQVKHPVERPHFDFHLAKIYFSDEMNMPIRYESWSWPTEPGGKPVLEEEYNYLDVKLNVGLTDRDFDINNPEYSFP